MAYEKTNWVDNETPITAEKLNHIEQGVEDAAKTGGVEVGTIVEWDDSEPIPEGYDIIEENEFLIESTLFTKVGNIVYIAMTEGALSAVTNLASFTLPEKFRPKQNITILGTYITPEWVGMIGRVYINADGTIKVRKIKTGNFGETVDATNGYISVNGSYMTN